MKKKFCIILCVALTVMCCFVACGNRRSENDSQKKEDLNEVIGGQNLPIKEELNADDIPANKIEKKYVEKISCIVEGKSDFAKEHEELVVEGVKTMSQDEAGDWYKLKKFYVSKKPVYSWDAEQNKILYGSPKILVFSEDLQHMGLLELFSETEDGEFMLIGVANAADDEMKDLLKNDRQKKFYIIAEQKFEYLLGEKNEIIASHGITKEVKGDYTGQLDKIGLSVSMGQLVDKSNLVEVILP